MTANNLKSILTKNLPNDLCNMVLSCFEQGEQLYYVDRWDLIEKNHKHIFMIEDPKIWSIYLSNYGSDAFIDNCIIMQSVNALEWYKDNGHLYGKYSESECAIALIGISGYLEPMKWTGESEEYTYPFSPTLMSIE